MAKTTSALLLLSLFVMAILSGTIEAAGRDDPGKNDLLYGPEHWFGWPPFGGCIPWWYAPWLCPKPVPPPAGPPPTGPLPSYGGPPTGPLPGYGGPPTGGFPGYGGPPKTTNGGPGYGLP